MALCSMKKRDDIISRHVHVLKPFIGSSEVSATYFLRNKEVLTRVVELAASNSNVRITAIDTISTAICQTITASYESIEAYKFAMSS
jgi:exosome complex RNA-binding protein Csl4